MAAVTSVAIGAIGTAASIKGARDQAQASKSASRLQQQAADAATAEQRRQFDLGRQDTQRFRQVGTAAVNQLAALYGLNAPGLSQGFEPEQMQQQTSLVGDTELPVDGRNIVPVGRGRYQVFYGDQLVGDLVPGGKNGRFVGNGAAIPAITGPKTAMAPDVVDRQGSGNGAPDFSAFFNSPDYEFARQEGTRGIERSAAARGGVASGNTLASLARFNSGLATQNFGNYTNRLASLAGIGQTSSESLADRRGNLAINVGNNTIAGAGARASGIQQRAGALGGIGSDLLGLSGYLSSLPGRNQYPDRLSQEQINTIFRPQNPYLPADY